MTTSPHPLTWFLLGFIAVALTLCGVPTQAQEYGTFGQGHHEMHEQYRQWKNDGGGSCCDGQDCRPVKATKDFDGYWQIWIPEYRLWVRVQPHAVGPTDKFHDGRSHACTANPATWKLNYAAPDALPVYCFSPAEMKI